MLCFTWNIFGTVLSLNAAPRCCGRKINTLDRQVIGSFFLIRPPWQGLAMHWPDFFSRLVAHAADHQAAPSMHDVVWWLDWTSLFVDVGFSTSQLALILSGASWLLSVTSWDAFVQWSLGPHCQGLQIDSGKSDAVRAHETTWTIFTHYQWQSVYNSSCVSCYAK